MLCFGEKNENHQRFLKMGNTLISKTTTLIYENDTLIRFISTLG